MRAAPALLRSLLITLSLAAVSVPLAAQRTPTKTDPALTRATEMFEGRSSATSVATELKSAYGVTDARAVQVLVTVGYSADAVAAAATSALRASPAGAARLMFEAGLQAVQIADGLARGPRVAGRRSLDALDEAKVPGTGSSDVYRASQASPSELAGYLRGKNESLRSTAATLRTVHGLTNDALVSSVAKLYAPREVVQFLSQDLAYATSDIRAALVKEELPVQVVDRSIIELGLEPGKPMIARWRIRDYDLDAGPGDYIDNAQIVNRSAVVQGASPIDGVVWIEGENLDHPDAEVWGATTGASPVLGEIRARTHLGGGIDQLEVFFPSFADAGFRVVTPGGEAAVGSQAWPVGYAAVDRDLFETALAGLSISIDSEVEVVFGGSVLTMPLDEHREAGMEITVLDMNDAGFSVSTAAAAGGAALVLTIPFEESGREFEGDFFGYIPCWKCGTLQVPQSDCGTISINCVLGFLGQGLASLGSCANLANWQEVEILDTQGVPFEGDLANTSLEVTMAMHVDNAGLGSSGTTFDFTSTISLASVVDDVSLSVVDPIVRERVNSRLVAAMGEIDLATTLVAALNQYAQVLGWERYLSVKPMPNGRLYVSFPG